MKTPINPHCPGRTVTYAFLFLVWLISLLSPSAHAQGTATLQITCPTNVTIWTCSSNAFYQYPPPTVTGSCTDYQVICSPPSGSLFPLGVTTVTCRVLGCQTSATCSFTVTVRQDTEPPDIRCPTNMLVRACPSPTGGCGAVVNYPAPIATDNSGSVAVTCLPPSGSFFPCGVHTVTCRAEDRCGNKDECQFTITVEQGGQAPGIQCPTDRVILTCSNSAVLTYPPPVVNPAGTSFTCTPPPGTVVPLGSHIVTCVAVNNCGTNDCKFTVTVRQVPPPSIQCPTAPFTVTAPCNSNCVPVFYPVPPVVNGTLIDCNPPPGTCLPVGNHPVVCRASNQCDVVSCTFLVRVIPGQGQPPGIQCPADLTILTCSNSAVLTYPAPVVNPPGTTVVCNPPSGTVVPLGVHTVTCVASNDCGTNQCSFKVTVRQVPPVSIQCPTNPIVVTLPCHSNCVPVFYPPPTVANGTLITCLPPPGTCLPAGIHMVTCFASNECDRVSCEFPVRVIPGQGQPPGIQCPADLTILTCSNSAVLTYPAPVVNPPGTTVICTPPSGTVVPLGVHIVTCVAVNDCGTNECKFTVTVRRRPPVSIECPTNRVVNLPCGSNCVPVVYPPPTVLNGTLIDCTPPSGTCLSAGVYVVICRASNECERVSCEFQVNVIPSQGHPPQIICPSNIVVWTCDSNGVVVNYPKPTVINGSDPAPTVTCLPPAGSVFPPGVTTVTCEVKDDCGGSDRCTFTVTVRRDTIPPDINCPSNIVVCVSNNVNGANVTYTVTATDNADPSPAIVCNPPSGSFFPLGTTVVVCRAVDECGNESRCFFTVSVLNDRPPKLSIRRDGRYVIICWPKTCSCYKLQYTRSLNTPIVWTDVAVAPDDSGDSWCVRLPIDGRHRFFRLIGCDQLTAPVFDVTGVGLTPNQAGRLTEALEIPHAGFVLDRGALLFVDPQGFQSIPTKPIQDPAIIDELSRGSENDKGELSFEAIDFAKLREIRAMDGEKAIGLFEGALRAADLLPANGDPVARHSLFEATDEKGEPMMPSTPIDTQVEYNFDLGGVPLIGPGAKLTLALSPEGKPTALHFMTRQLQPAQEIPILSLDEAARRCAALYPQLRSTGVPRLVYYAPSLLLPAVKKVIPCYECGGSAPAGDEQLQLLRAIIPATDDSTLVPAVQLEASADGTLINAKAMVNGGTPPYLYEWTSSSAELSFPPDASSIEYNARPRADAVTETVKVMITDANGMTAQASQTLPISGPGAAGFFSPLVFSPAVGGVTDYGTERGVSDLCAAQQAAFNARFAADGIFRRFNWFDTTAWERDFKEGPTGLDHLYVDNVDMTFYMGHGSGAGFTFENNHDDTQVHYNDVVGAWGDIDLEWLALLSCSVIADTHGGKSWAQRWGPAFSGLHLMLGFANTAYDEAGFGGAFANWTLGYQLGFITLPPVPVRSAWFLAHDGHQPASVFAAAMGVIGPDGLSNYNDYFWGKGPVGPDIRGAQIHGYWRVKHD